jgi:hypothetical protein
LQKEPWKPVFVFVVSGLGTPASRRLAVSINFGFPNQSKSDDSTCGYWRLVFVMREYEPARTPNVIYFLQKEPWKPVFVFVVSGLGTPASRRLAIGILTIQESTR